MSKDKKVAKKRARKVVRFSAYAKLTKTSLLDIGLTPEEVMKRQEEKIKAAGNQVAYMTCWYLPVEVVVRFY